MARKRRSGSPDTQKRRRYPRSSRVRKSLPFFPSPTRVSLLNMREARRIPGNYRSPRTLRRKAPIVYGEIVDKYGDRFNEASVYPTKDQWPEPDVRRKRTKREVLMFASPRYTIMCIKRKVRKEVMFAVGKGGKKGKQKKPRITEESRIRC